MHEIQEKLLQFSREKNLGQYTLREIGGFINVHSPQKVKHHLQQLEKRGLIKIDKIKGIIEPIQPGWTKRILKKAARIFNIPIYGMAQCGPKGVLAEQNLEGFLRVSDALLQRKPKKSFFVVQASGLSMNAVNVEGKSIDDGDYLIIDRELINPLNDDVILGIIDNMAVIKKYIKDEKNEQIILKSESTQNFPPIYLHKNDNFIINGKVVQVIKKPN
ncbi:MAG: S24 family peptidase [bacterium]|nr:S24 family peptidase [bacterium]